MPGPKLLSRDAFREGVFARDGGICVFCDKPAVDAHHIIERRLWPDGGYYMENGASVCEEHHLACEMTSIPVEEVRIACGITKIIVPPHLYADQPYDKWGNPVLANGQRVRGELFEDESVQKILAAGGVLQDFTHWVKYPRTHHAPWSGGINDDDRVIETMAAFDDQRVILTEKMDGENTTFYCDYIHARSVDGRHHVSRDWIKQFWSQRAHDIPDGWRVCVENLYAKHSIGYDALPSYCLAFSVWNERNIALAWDETLEWLELLGILPVPALYDGPYDEPIIREICAGLPWETSEGAVLRVAGPIAYGEFRHKVAKIVRKGHVQTVKHWMHGEPVTPNGLSSEKDRR